MRSTPYEGTVSGAGANFPRNMYMVNTGNNRASVGPKARQTMTTTTANSSPPTTIEGSRLLVSSAPANAPYGEKYSAV